jgi:peptide/nickel transport system ATP-binding protein
MDKPMLEARNLSVKFQDPKGDIFLIQEINLSLKRGEIFALVGESGSGKTTLAYALTKLFFPFSRYETSGDVYFAEHNLLQLEDHALRQIRRKNIRYVFQEPAQSLNPISRIKTQYVDAIVNVTPMEAKRAVEKAKTDLKNVGIENPDDVLRSYPHELSGGTLQRILIALALSPNPELIIADEPTSSVDAPLRFQLLDLLDNARKNGRSSVLLITHDLDVANRYADTIAVMYAGRIVEVAPKHMFFDTPLHPYSQVLCKGARLTDSSIDDLAVLSENPPHPSDLPRGCKFHPICYKVHDDCRLFEPQLESIEVERKVRCPYWK